jgi:trimeric autotransporter adhesin
MSTKTTFKRVALVAVAALGLGVLTSVAPASAAQATGVTIGTVGPARAGSVLSVGITLTLPTTFGAADTMTVGAKVISAPTGSAFNSVAASATATPVINGANAAGFTGAGNLVAAKIGWTSSTSRLSDVAGANGAANTGMATGTNIVAGGADRLTAAGYVIDAAYDASTNTTGGATLNIVPDVAGTYTVLVHSSSRVVADGTAAGAYAAGDAVSQFTFTTGGAPTALTAKSVAGAVVDNGTNGQLISLTLKDANGNATVLGINEAITFADTSADTKLVAIGGTVASTAISSFGISSDVAGTYYVQVVDDSAAAIADGASTLTFTGSGTLPATLTTNTSVTLVKASASTATVLDIDATDLDVVNTGTSVPVGRDYSTAGSSHIFKVTQTNASTTATVKYPVDVTAAGTGAIKYSTTVSVKPEATSGLVTITSAMSATQTAGLTVTTNSLIKTVGYQKPAAATVAVQGQASVLSATAAKNTFTVKVADQYAGALAFQSVSVAVSGRNTVATTALGVTDANGLISYSLTDAGTTGTRDTITFTVTGLTPVTATVTYGTVTVDSVTVSGGSKAETIAGSTLTAIDGADNGPEASAVPVKAVVKDASGNLLAGVAVTFTVDAGAIKKTAAIDYATVYTGADGSATTYAFNWLVGKQTITATAGGKSSTDYLTWAATDASTARVLSATATGDIVSLKVVDRFGNPVKGVSIDLSRTGTGLFGSGKSTDTATTDKNGTADIRFIGSGSVVAELAATYAQAYDVAGQIEEEAATAAVAGTTKGTGASLAPAGVAKATVAISEGSDPVAVSSQAAADAAAEATDAANAATDAANAAAEAADAATAAAQDAADAVAALSTQVSEMVSALKKQITALTNLVIKIQKKVNA